MKKWYNDNLELGPIPRIRSAERGENQRNLFEIRATLNRGRITIDDTLSQTVSIDWLR